MAGRDRVAALKRARDRQRRIEDQVTKAIRAYAVAERVRASRERAIGLADQRLAAATNSVMHETAQLVSTCGSAAAVAEILDIDIREVRRAMSVVGSPPSGAGSDELRGRAEVQ